MLMYGRPNRALMYTYKTYQIKETDADHYLFLGRIWIFLDFNWSTDHHMHWTGIGYGRPAREESCDGIQSAPQHISKFSSSLYECRKILFEELHVEAKRLKGRTFPGAESSRFH